LPLFLISVIFRFTLSNNADQITSWERELPDALAARLVEPLIQREIAALLPSMRRELVYLLDYLAERSNSFAISIGHLVKRVETFTSTVDASNLGGGAHCRDLQFWFSYIWSSEISRRANLPKKHPDKIHINLSEFVVALI
jgi:hypothetical protein